jgi:RNA 2',3'-cyclic 3'-phosphodiesterase
MSASSASVKRLFFAVWPTDDLRREIEQETRRAVEQSGGRATPAANFHITIAFLGPVPLRMLDGLRACARRVDVPVFELVLGKLAWWEAQGLLCVEPVTGVEALQELAERVQSTLRQCGFTIERRPFRGHMTLARDVRSAHEFKPIRQLRWIVDRVELIESQTSAKGSEYTILSA